jgi:FkbM family methyltransferase
MAPWLKLILQKLMAMTHLDIRRSLPAVTLEPLDLVLANYDARGEMITVLQVGACDGVTNDPICHHVAKGFARAILVEPNPLAFVRLQKNYTGVRNVTLIQAAIGEQDGEAHLYRAKKTEKMESEVDLTLQLASFYREHLEHHVKKPDEIERITVPCRSLSSLVAELGLTNIDLLQIDVEGFDAAVVRMALKMPVLPNCINFEHRHLKPADRRPLFDLLEANGYLLSYDEWNILALRNATSQESEKRQNGLGPYLRDESAAGAGANHRVSAPGIGARFGRPAQEA